MYVCIYLCLYVCIYQSMYVSLYLSIYLSRMGSAFSKDGGHNNRVMSFLTFYLSIYVCISLLSISLPIYVSIYLGWDLLSPRMEVTIMELCQVMRLWPMPSYLELRKIMLAINYF